MGGAHACRPDARASRLVPAAPASRLNHLARCVYRCAGPFLALHICPGPPLSLRSVGFQPQPADGREHGDIQRGSHQPQVSGGRRLGGWVVLPGEGVVGDRAFLLRTMGAVLPACGRYCCLCNSAAQDKHMPHTCLRCGAWDEACVQA